MEAVIRDIGILAWAVVALALVLGIAVPYQPRAATLPPGMRNPLLALQLAPTPDAVRQTVPTAEDRLRLRANTLFDCAFIFGYWLLFLALAVLLMRRAPWIGGAAALTATVGALADYVENAAILRCLAAGEGGPTARVVTVKYRAALVKWIALYLLAALLVPLFWRADGFVIVALACLATAVAGAVSVRWRGWMAAAIFPLAFGVVIVAIGFTFVPQLFLVGF